MKKFYAFSLLIFLNFSAFAQIVNIPDANFKAKLLAANTTNQIAYPLTGWSSMTIDANGNGEIEQSEAALVRTLALGNSSIGSLEGIAAFTNLQVLDCKNNNLTALNLNSLTHLINLDFTNNQLTTFDLSSLAELYNVSCAQNQLSSLTASQFNVAVRDINCSNNNLTALNLNSLVNLSKLNCSYNQLATLNVEQINDKIEWLDCSYNNLTSFAVPNFFAFQDQGDQVIYLNCSHNQLTQIAFNQTNGHEDFSSVNLSDNNFTDLHIANMSIYGGMTVSNNPLNNLTFSSVYFGPQDPDGSSGLSVENTNLVQFKPPTGSAFHLTISNNPNLVSIDLKNNSANVFGYWYVDPETEEETWISYGITIENNPSLAMVCCDEDEVEYISSLVPTAQVTEYCDFLPAGSYNTITGTVSLNCPNGTLIDSNVKVVVNTYQANFIGGQNHYTYYSGSGTQNVSLNLPHPNYFTVSPPNYTFNFTNFGNVQTANFCLTANGVHPDLEVVVLPLTAARPGFDATYQIIYTNRGNQTQSGTLTFNYDETVLDLVSTNPAVNSQASGVLNWNFTDLVPFESRSVTCKLNVNSPQETPAVNIGNILIFSAMAATAVTDETPNDNTSTLTQTVVGSYDPNDKVVSEGSLVDINKIGDYLHYTIRFQNTGTAAAENVVVKDNLSYLFDLTTLEMTASSHPYRSTLSGQKLEFFFENINLPSASADEPGSHGFVSFKIKPRPVVSTLYPLDNTGLIYFDYNLPIFTNTTSTLYFDPLKTQQFEGKSLVLYPNPVRETLHVKTSDTMLIRSIHIYNLMGQLVQEVSTANARNIDVSKLKAATYFIEIISEEGKFTQKFVKL